MGIEDQVAERQARIARVQEARNARIAARQGREFNASYTDGGFQGNSNNGNGGNGFSLRGINSDIRDGRNLLVNALQTVGVVQAGLAGDINGLERDRWRSQRYRMTAQANTAEIRAIQSGQRLDQVRNGEVPQGGVPFRGPAGQPSAFAGAPGAAQAQAADDRTFQSRVQPLATAIEAILSARTPEAQQNAINHFAQLSSQYGVDTPIRVPADRRLSADNYGFTRAGGTDVDFPEGGSFTPRQFATSALTNKPELAQALTAALGAAPGAPGVGAGRTTVANPQMVGTAVVELSERINADAANRAREGDEALVALRSMGFQNINDRVTIAQPLQVRVGDRVVNIPANTYSAQEFTGLVRQQLGGLAQAQNQGQVQPTGATPTNAGATRGTGGGTPGTGTGGTPATSNAAPGTSTTSTATVPPAFPTASATRAHAVGPLRGGYLPPMGENQVKPLQARLDYISNDTNNYHQILTSPPPRDPTGIDGLPGFRTVAAGQRAATAAGVDWRQLDFTTSSPNEATARFNAYVEAQIALVQRRAAAQTQTQTQTPVQVQVGPATPMVPATTQTAAAANADPAARDTAVTSDPSAARARAAGDQVRRDLATPVTGAADVTEPPQAAVVRTEKPPARDANTPA